MKIALPGASGFIGTALLHEALQRGHHVTALVGRPDRVTLQPRLHVERADVLNTSVLAGQLHGHDVVISAFSGHNQAHVYDYYLQGITSLMTAVKMAHIPRLLVVGGAGSLEVAPGMQLVDTPDFPAQWKQTAEGARQALNLLREEKVLNWTMLSPAAHIEPGPATGEYRLGRDQLLTDAQGNSRISLGDFAKAMLDEVENPRHERQRFCVAY